MPTYYQNMKKTIFTIVLSVVALSYTMAQDSDFDAFVKKQQTNFDNFVKDKQAEFDAFRKKANQDYADFMRQAWKPIRTQPAEEPVKEKTQPPVIYQEPQLHPDVKPEPQPEVAPQPQPKPQPDIKPQPEQKPIPVKPDVVVVPQPQPAPEPIAPVKPQIDESQYQNVSVSYYGTLITLPFPKKDNLKITKFDESGLADMWDALSEKKYDRTIKSALDLRETLTFGDWAYMNMLKAITDKRYGRTNESVLMTAFLMTQSGYKVRLAKTTDKLYMFFASDYKIYGTSFITIGNTNFYLFDGKDKSGQLSLCPAKFDKEQRLSMQIAQLPKLSVDLTANRNLVSNQGVKASVCSNMNLINFLGDYPVASIGGGLETQWVAYVNTPLDADAQRTLYPALRNAVRGKTELQAVNLLLNLVQTAFEYGYDDVIWGGDRPFFAQETLYYPYSDCEDRAALFSRIVRDILGLDVVLLHYPGHLAAAVAFTQPVKGDYLLYKNKRYTVCDPTYINASVGCTMPGMNNQQATIIVL